MSNNRKPKRWFTSAFDDDVPPALVRSSASFEPPTATSSGTTSAPVSKGDSITKRAKLSRTGSLSSTTSGRESRPTKAVDWSVDLAPKTTADLAIHPKKLDEIKQWLKVYDRVKETDPVAILLVSGPAGCGKTTAIKVIAEECGYHVSEWTTPVDVDLFFHDNYDFDNDREQVTYRENQQQKFDKFLYKSSRYCSIFEDGSDQKLLLVKDIPNIFLRDPAALQSSLEAYQESGASPLVFVATDTSNRKLDIVFNLFPPAVLQDFRVHHITFNTVSTTLMKKAVKRISSLMVGPNIVQNYRVPSQDLIDSIVLSSQGDLRNVTLNMHFASLKDAPKLDTEKVESSGEALNTSGGSSRAKKKESKLKSVGCNEGITLMHALGRVFNPKYDRTATDEERLHHSPEELADAFVSQPGSMVSLVHSNYVTRFTDIDDITGAADALSLADVIMSEYREDQLSGHALNILLRGMMVSNRKVAGGWQQIRKKKFYDKPSVINHESQLRKFGLQTSSISAGLFITDYKKYLDIIHTARV